MHATRNVHLVQMLQRAQSAQGAYTRLTGCNEARNGQNALRGVHGAPTRSYTHYTALQPLPLLADGDEGLLCNHRGLLESEECVIGTGTAPS